MVTNCKKCWIYCCDVRNRLVNIVYLCISCHNWVSVMISIHNYDTNIQKKKTQTNKIKYAGKKSLRSGIERATPRLRIHGLIHWATESLYYGVINSILMWNIYTVKANAFWERLPHWSRYDVTTLFWIQAKVHSEENLKPRLLDLELEWNGNIKSNFN